MSSGQEHLPGPEPAPDRPSALDRCRQALREEGFRVTEAGSTDLRAHRGSRIVRALVLVPGDVDDPETEARIRRTYDRGETRVFVPWRFKWRMASNLGRWGIRGVALSDY